MTLSPESTCPPTQPLHRPPHQPSPPPPHRQTPPPHRQTPPPQQLSQTPRWHRIRLIGILRVLLAYGIEDLLFPSRPPLVLRLLRGLLRVRRIHDEKPLAIRIREALMTLGPIYVKFGQALSTRPDLIPDDLAQELTLLQDQVSPFPGATAVAMIESSLGAPLTRYFSEFDATPLASASVAQVHAATLCSGEAVVVKVIRPDIEHQIALDVALLVKLAWLLERLWAPARLLQPRAVVAEFRRCLSDEIDLRRDGANASLLRRNFADSSALYVPRIYWEFTRRDILVMERVSGTRITDVARLVAAGVDLKALAAQGVDIFFTQVFVHNFFHADMHPGNLFIDISRPEAPRYVAMDFGIMGTLPEDEQRALAAIFQAFFQRDYLRIAQLHKHLGWIAPQVSVDAFAAEIRMVCEPIFDKPLGEISFGLLLVNLFRSAHRFDMHVQPHLLLLQKTLINIEGLGRTLYPELDLWSTAKPFIEQWIRQQFSPARLMARLWANLPFWLAQFDQLPTPAAPDPAKPTTTHRQTRSS